MLVDERQHRLLSLLRLQGRIETEALVETLQVSRETVRRDLLQLEAEGLLRRIHGGAVCVDPIVEPSAGERRLKRADEKRLIAKAAVQHVRPGQACFIDTGTTTALFAAELAFVPNVSVITNALEVATLLRAAQPAADITLLGGQLSEDGTASYGELALAQLERFHADWAILSPVGLHADHGVTYFRVPEAEMARAMQNHAARTMVLADRTKVGLVSRVAAYPCRGIDLLICDRMDEADAGALRRSGVRTIIGGTTPA